MSLMLLVLNFHPMMLNNQATDHVPTLRAFLGGSFNPPHLGHLAMAGQVDRALAMLGVPYQMSLMPSHNPFKNPIKDDQHSTMRQALIGCALDEYNLEHGTKIGIETYELDLNTYPTYTIETLAALGGQHPKDTLIFVVGQDSFENMHRWRGGFGLLSHCHLWVFSRPNGQLAEGQQTQAPSAAMCLHPAELLLSRSGRIFWDRTPILGVSSTAIRQTIEQLFANAQPLAVFCEQLGAYLPRRVIAKIYQDKLYQI